jgi:hypothetical protein
MVHAEWTVSARLAHFKGRPAAVAEEAPFFERPGPAMTKNQVA